MTGIFIKTYPGDFNWLTYMLRSIEKFATGFSEITVVTDDGTPLTLPDNIKDMPVRVFYVPKPEVGHPCPVGVGYVWAQNVKLHWFQFTSCESVLSIDSDCMFTGPVSPETWQDKDGRWKWWRRPYAEIAVHFKDVLKHKPPADQFMKTDVIYHNMLFNGWILLRNETISMHQYLHDVHGCDLWEYLTTKSYHLWGEGKWGSCEYEMYGNFVAKYRADSYKFVAPDEENPMPPVRQSWSWGGLQEEDLQQREAILAG